MYMTTHVAERATDRLSKWNRATGATWTITHLESIVESLPSRFSHDFALVLDTSEHQVLIPGNDSRHSRGKYLVLVCRGGRPITIMYSPKDCPRRLRVDQVVYL